MLMLHPACKTSSIEQRLESCSHFIKQGALVAWGRSSRLRCAGVTSENVASRYGISRQQQDEMAARSHARAAKARASGRFKDEIVPVKTTIKDKEVRTAPRLAGVLTIVRAKGDAVASFSLWLVVTLAPH